MSIVESHICRAAWVVLHAQPTGHELHVSFTMVAHGVQTIRSTRYMRAVAPGDLGFFG